MKRLDGKLELRGGTDDDRSQGREDGDLSETKGGCRFEDEVLKVAKMSPMLDHAGCSGFGSVGFGR